MTLDQQFMKQNIIKITKCLNTLKSVSKQENHSKASIKQTKFDSEFRGIIMASLCKHDSNVCDY